MPDVVDVNIGFTSGDVVHIECVLQHDLLQVSLIVLLIQFLELIVRVVVIKVIIVDMLERLLVRP